MHCVCVLVACDVCCTCVVRVLYVCCLVLYVCCMCVVVVRATVLVCALLDVPLYVPLYVLLYVRCVFCVCCVFHNNARLHSPRKKKLPTTIYDKSLFSRVTIENTRHRTHASAHRTMIRTYSDHKPGPAPELTQAPVYAQIRTANGVRAAASPVREHHAAHFARA